MIELDTKPEFGAKIRIVGVGGGGGNAVNAMINKGLEGVEFCVLNTDAQALEKSAAPVKVQIGKNLTRGLGAGADPEIGRKAVEEDRDEILRMLAGSDMVFVTAGMGGGTGTGGAASVAAIAKSVGALVVGIVTKPFQFEGKRRTRQADEGIEELRRSVDTLIVIPNQKLLALVQDTTSFLEGFSLANQVLYNATRGISELIIRHGYINVDFADVRTVMKEMGDAIMGSGVGRGEHRAAVAAEHAISSPLLEGVSINGAQGVLVNITGGRSMSLLEVSEATQIIHDAAGDDANLIFGAVLDDTMDEEIMVTVIATGFNTRPKFTGLSVDRSGSVTMGLREEPVAKPRVERITPPMEPNYAASRGTTQVAVAPAPTPQQPAVPSPIREAGMSHERPRSTSGLPPVERMFQPRGTLTEKERPTSFDRERMETPHTNGAPLRITSKNDYNNAPSGTRDLKDYDQPAYLRRGVTLPPVEDAEEMSMAQATPSPQREEQRTQAPSGIRNASGLNGESNRRDQDDRPAFLKRIMD